MARIAFTPGFDGSAFQIIEGPVEFLVVLSLQAALQQIAQANGYHNDVAAIAVKLDPEVAVDTLIGDQKLRPYAVLEVNPDAVTLLSLDNGIAVVLPFTVHFTTDLTPEQLQDDAAWIRTYFELCADVEQALAQDLTRGGLAATTRITGRQASQQFTATVWAQVKGNVEIERTLGQPNG